MSMEFTKHKILILVAVIMLITGGFYLSKRIAVEKQESGAAGTTLPELPRVYLDTTYSPPTSGTVRIVNTGGNLQTALDAAVPGDIVELQAGAPYTGNFILRNKTGSGWIYIRSSAHAQLPAPGKRVTPAQAALMPKIVSPNNAPALRFDFGAHHWRFVGIEIATTWAVTSSSNSNLILMGYDIKGNAPTSLSQLPTDITFERCYIHGTPTGNVRRGITPNATRFAVIDSYISEIHEVGGDSQAIGVWNGPGPFKIVNNYLEGAAENVIFGGADPSIPNLISSDIEIRGNHFFKPLSWKIDDPSYAGIPWSVKNLFEIKNAQRVLLDGNVFENNWTHAQTGFAFVLKSTNQSGAGPWSVAQDITMTNNIIRHTNSVLNLCSNCPASQQASRFLIKNNLFEDIGALKWGGNGAFLQVLNGVNNTTVDHNTVIHTGGGSPVVTADGVVVSTGFVFTNNIMRHNLYGVKGSGAGVGNSTLNLFFPGFVFEKNVISELPVPQANYPPNNFFPTTLETVGFLNLTGGDYRLVASSPYKNAGTDGKDVGADITAINTATACTISGNCGGSAPSINPADLNSDGKVDVIDLGVLLGSWNATNTPPADINKDNKVDVVDLGMLLGKWGD